MISNIRFERQNNSVWHQWLRKCTGLVEPALMMQTDVFGVDMEVLGVQGWRNQSSGKAVEPWRGYKDKTPWRSMTFKLCHAFPIGEVDPKSDIPSRYELASLRCHVFLQKNSQGDLELKLEDQWRISRGVGCNWEGFSTWNRPRWNPTDVMMNKGGMFAQELQTIVPVIFDPQWWWSFKYSEEMNRQDYWQAKLDKSKKTSDKYVQELVSRQMMVPV